MNSLKIIAEIESLYEELHKDEDVNYYKLMVAVGRTVEKLDQLKKIVNQSRSVSSASISE